MAEGTGRKRPQSHVRAVFEYCAQTIDTASVKKKLDLLLSRKCPSPSGNDKSNFYFSI